MFDWDENNLGHIAGHDVSRFEVEEAILDADAVIPVVVAVVRGEIRFATIGRARNGRVIGVIFANRSNKIRVVTAYPARGRQLRRYQEGVS